MNIRNNIFLGLMLIASATLSNSFSGYNMQRQIDSLKTILDTAIVIETKLKALSDVSWQLKNINPEEGLKYAKQGLDLAIKNNNKKYIADFYKNTGVLNKNIGQYETALDNFQISLRYSEQLGDKKGIASCFGNIGILYKDMGDPDKSIMYYEKALEMFKQLNAKGPMAASHSNIGLLYLDKRNYTKALEQYNLSMNISVEMDNQEGINMLNMNIGIVYSRMGNYSKALEYFQKSEIFLKQSNNLGELVLLKQNIAEVYTKKGDHKKALELVKESIEASEKMNLYKPLKNNYQLLSKIYASMGNYKEALDAHRHYSLLSDSLINEDRIKAVTEMDTKYKTEKKDKEIIELNKNKTINELEIAKKNSDLNRQQIITWSIVAVLSLVVLLSFYVYKNYREKQKANIIIMHQKELVEEKQKEILDSISYAKRLQQAILPPLALVNKYFPENFILYKPKDIVAGDFYWMEIISRESRVGRMEKKNIDTLTANLLTSKNSELLAPDSELILISAADCTGHGVPGAMVSVVCSNALNRAVKEFKLVKPGEILDKVRELVVETFVRQENSIEEKNEYDVKDGMDISFCAINKKENILQWAGANNPLWIIRDNIMMEYKANKEPIGKTDNPTPFTTQTIQLQKNDLIYLFTDGLADQFGGPKGKKFKYKQFQELLLSSSGKTMAEQKDVLENSLNDWRGNLEQVDDILIIGIRV